MSTEQDRSQSRGRSEVFHSSGRGGSGNIRPDSASRDARPTAVKGPDDFSPTRGREMAVSHKVTHSGRGGAGNIRSPSRDPQPATPGERDAIAHAAERDAELPHSSGRGGFGNITAASRSRSRSRSRLADGVHSSGRGGAGNIVHGVADQALLEEKERKAHHVKEDIHSSGRGGAGNVTASLDPGIDHPPHAHEEQQFHSSGRGGAGNIYPPTETKDDTVPSVSNDEHS